MEKIFRNHSRQIQSFNETFYMSQMIPKKNSTIQHFQFNYHTLPVTPFKVYRLTSQS